jgi:hypothetical protein
MTDETNRDSKPNNGRRVDASRGAIARKINRLPPGEHLVELRARVMPDQTLRIAAASQQLGGAGTTYDLNRLFGPEPPDTDVRGKRAYEAQGSFWLSLLEACGLSDDQLRDITLEEVAEKINGKQVVAIINASGYWSRVRPI